MMDYVMNFHFLRPWFLLGLVPLFFWRWFVSLTRSKTNVWRKAFDAPLFRHMFAAREERRRQSTRVIVAIWILLAISLSGPVWREKPQAMYKNLTPTVIVLDTSLSMNAEDIAPTRLARGILKAYDILEYMQGALFSLIIYSAEPFVIVPLTDDAAVMETYLPIISTNLMPIQGSRLDRAIDLAVEELKKSYLNAAHIVVITDSAGHDQAAIKKAVASAKKAFSAGYLVSVLGVGTEQGAIVRTDNAGGRATTNLEEEGLIEVIKAGGGRFHQITNDNADIRYLFADMQERMKKLNPMIKAGINATMWEDEGYWFLLPVLALFPFLFRRGFITAWFLFIVLAPGHAHAFDWRWFFLSTEQYGHALLEDGDYEEAGRYLHTNPQLYTLAMIKGKTPEAVLPLLHGTGGFEDFYNMGTMLAMGEEYLFALQMLEKAKNMDPDSYEAAFNYEVVKRLIDFEKKGAGGDGDQSEEGESDGDNDSDKRGDDENDQSEQEQDQEQDSDDSGEPPPDTPPPPPTGGIGENPEDLADFLKNKINAVFSLRRYGLGAEEKQW